MSNVSYETNIWTMVRTPDFPSRLFKFMKAEYAALMCQSNRVRYGTIYDFRKQENHGHGVLDKEEGLLHYTEHVTEATDSQLGAPLQGFAGPNARFENCSFRNITSTEPDQWVYCLSLSDSWDADIDPEYTVCVEIFDPRGFILALAKKIALSGKIENFWHHAAVEYRDRNIAVHNNRGVFSEPPPDRLGVIKPFRFAHQKEYRVLWVPKNQGVGTIEPFVVRIPGLSRYCRHYSFRPAS